jgi:hypothetical protein
MSNEPDIDSIVQDVTEKAAKATPRPWHEYPNTTTLGNRHGQDVRADCDLHGRICANCTMEDMAFIVSACNHARALAAEVTRMKGELAAADNGINWYCNSCKIYFRAPNGRCGKCQLWDSQRIESKTLVEQLSAKDAENASLTRQVQAWERAAESLQSALAAEEASKHE